MLTSWNQVFNYSELVSLAQDKWNWGYFRYEEKL